MPDIAPAEDTDFIEFVASVAIGNYARGDGFQPFAIVHTGEATMIVPSQGFPNNDAKQEFVNILRYISIEHSGQRSAFAMEVWTMDSRDPEDQRLMGEIHERGGSISEHPKAGEAVFVIAESDAGTTTRMHRIVRNGDEVTLEAGKTEFDVRTVPPTYRGTFSNFHVPTGFQPQPAAQAFAAQMRELVPSQLVRLDPTEAPKAN